MADGVDSARLFAGHPRPGSERKQQQDHGDRRGETASIRAQRQARIASSFTLSQCFWVRISVGKIRSMTSTL
jgi:hypothetical protein